MPLQSPLHERHVALGAKFAEFGGWAMPLEYPTGVLREHATVREHVGIFDVSHLGKLVLRGPGASEHVNDRLTNDLGRIGPGRAQYTLCCDDATGGIVDDLIVYYLAEDHVLLVPNAANTAEVAGRLAVDLPAGVHIEDQHRSHFVIAVQGAACDDVLDNLGLPSGHEYMSFVVASYAGADVVVCRTGYTGERGYELIGPNESAGALWDALLAAAAAYDGVPCGLGARDTLRLEMGYPLHGQDITRETTPVQTGLGWAVGWKKPAFWGRDVLIPQREAREETGVRVALRGLVATGRGIPRPGMGVRLGTDLPIGTVTSGTFSPTLRRGIALALMDAQPAFGTEVNVDVRGRTEIFVVTKPPFVTAGVREVAATPAMSSRPLPSRPAHSQSPNPSPGASA